MGWDLGLVLELPGWVPDDEGRGRAEGEASLEMEIRMGFLRLARWREATFVVMVALKSIVFRGGFGGTFLRILSRMAPKSRSRSLSAFLGVSSVMDAWIRAAYLVHYQILECAKTEAFGVLKVIPMDHEFNGPPEAAK